MIFKNIKLTFCISFLFIPFLVFSDTLEDALILTYQTNPDLLAARAKLMEQDEAYAIALSGWLPTLSAGGNYTFSRNRQKTSLTNYSNTDQIGGEISLSQPLFTGGRVSASLGEAKANIYAGRENLKNTEQQILISAIQAYIDVRRDFLVLEIRKNNVDVLTRQLNAAKDRFDVGEGTKTDQAQAEARLSSALSDLSKAETQLAISRETYRKIIGQYPASLKKEPKLTNLPEKLEEAIYISKEHNPSLRSSQFLLIATDKGVQKAKSALMPVLSAVGKLSASYQQHPITGEKGSASIGANLSIPLYQGGVLRSKIRAAKHRQHQQKHTVRSVERQVLEAVTNAWNTYHSSKIIIASSKKQVEANEIAFQGVELENQVGLRTTLDVLNAEQELLEARLALVFAERNAYIESFRLLQKMGKLDLINLGISLEPYDVEKNYKRVKKITTSISSE